MFNLFRSRDKAVRILLGGILGVVAISMVMYLVPGAGSTTGSTTDDNILAEIGGQKLTVQDAQSNFDRVAQNNQIPPELRGAYFPQYLQAKLGNMAEAYEAQRTGLTVSDDEILAFLASSNPEAFQNGVLISKDQYIQFLAAQGLTLQDAIDQAKEQLLATKLQNVVYESIVVTPQEVEAEFSKKYEKAKIQYIAFPTPKFADQAKPTEDDLRKYFDSRRSFYTETEKVSFQVVVLDQEKVEATITIPDAQLRAAYSASMDNFRMPEKLHVRHILLKTEGKADADKKTARSKADDLLKQLKSGADFAELAKKNSDDTASAEKGGDLDWIVKGQIGYPEFESAVFALKPKEMTGVVTTQLGFEIAQLVERQPAKVKPFEEVKDGLAADLKKQTITDKMQMTGDQIHDALVKAPGSAAEVAIKNGAELVTQPKGERGGAIPTLGNSPEIDGVLANMKPNEVSQVLTLPANRLAVVVLNSRIAARPSDFIEVHDKVRDDYVRDKSKDLAEAKAKEAAERLNKGEDINTIAKSMKLDAVTTNFFGRSDAVDGLGQAVYIEAAFTKPVGTILGPTEIPPGSHTQVVSRVDAKLGADPAAMAAEKAQLTQQLKSRKANQAASLLADSILTKLTSEGKVKSHAEAIQRAISTYTQR
jgi:peptidyl-prolyl cis-trans isomerase D